MGFGGSLLLGGAAGAGMYYKGSDWLVKQGMKANILDSAGTEFKPLLIGGAAAIGAGIGAGRGPYGHTVKSAAVTGLAGTGIGMGYHVLDTASKWAKETNQPKGTLWGRAKERGRALFYDEPNVMNVAASRKALESFSFKQPLISSLDEYKVISANKFAEEVGGVTRNVAAKEAFTEMFEGLESKSLSKAGIYGGIAGLAVGGIYGLATAKRRSLEANRSMY